MQLRYKKFLYDKTVEEVLELGEVEGIYRTDRIGTIKHLPEHKLGESFDYVIITKYSDDLYDTLNENIMEVFKVRDNMIVVLIGAYISEEEYKVQPISEIPNNLISNCYIVDYPSSKALPYIPIEEKIKIFSNIKYTLIARVYGFSSVGVLTHSINLYNWLTLDPQIEVHLNSNYSFANLIDNNSKDLHSKYSRAVFTDQDLSEIYNNYLKDIYEKAKTN